MNHALKSSPRALLIAGPVKHIRLCQQEQFVKLLCSYRGHQLAQLLEVNPQI